MARPALLALLVPLELRPVGQHAAHAASAMSYVLALIALLAGGSIMAAVQGSEDLAGGLAFALLLLVSTLVRIGRDSRVQRVDKQDGSA